MKKIIKFLNAGKNKLLRYYISSIYGVRLGNGVIFRNKPFLVKHHLAKIIIGKGTIINSSNRNYHLNMFQKCKIYADRADALITIGENCRIHGTCIHAYSKITIGDNCLIAANTNIIDGNGHQLSFENPENRINTTDSGKSITIGNNVWIAANCIILGGANIGNGSIITAGSIIKGEVPPMSIYGGNPAKLIKKY